MTFTKIYYFYIVRCIDNSLYSGVTTDLGRRVEEHNTSSSGAKYTRLKRPVELVYYEQFAGRSSAQKREWQVKQMPKLLKEKLIKNFLI